MKHKAGKARRHRRRLSIGRRHFFVRRRKSVAPIPATMMQCSEKRLSLFFPDPVP
jgi:hypothetical protein